VIIKSRKPVQTGCVEKWLGGSGWSRNALITPIPNLLHELSHIHFLVLHIYHPGMFQHPPRSGSSRRFFLKTAQDQHRSYYLDIEFHIPAFDKILEVVRPINSVLRFILQFWNGLTDDVREKVDQSCARLHLCAVCRERESMLGNFQQCNTERPDIGCNGI
jgi:hypothetical protein